MVEERRRAIRIKKVLVAQFQEKDSPQNWNMTQIMDISEVGLVMFMEKILPAGTELHLRIKVPINPSAWYEFDGKVIDCEKHRVRVEITAMGDDTKGILREFVAWFLKQQSPKIIDKS
jgi:hypothetical protein